MLQLLFGFVVCYLIIDNTHQAAHHLPPGFLTCHKSSPDFNECVQNAIEDAIHQLSDGYKPLGINALEPLHVDSIHVGNRSSSGSSVNIEQKYDNVKFYGQSTSKIIKSVIDIDACNFHIEAITPKLRMEGDYAFSGQVLIINLNSKGFSNTSMPNMKTIHDIHCERITKANKVYLKITDYQMQLVPEKVVFNFTNTVENAPEIAAGILNTINENALAIFEEIRADYEQILALIYTQIGNRLFAKVPENEIFLD